MPAPLPVSIRRLGPDDADAFRALRLLTLQTEPAFFGTLHAAEAALPLSRFAAVIAESSVFGAFAGAVPVGTLRLTRATQVKERHKGSLHGVFVRPEWRQNGVGAALMRAVLAEAAATGLERLTLAVVADNGAAIALYTRWGFTTYGVEPRARFWDDRYQDMVLMGRAVAP